MIIGMLGGSFCPPTIAHLELSKMCIEQGLCDKVIWVPVNDAYRKSTNIQAEHRVNMVKYQSDISSTQVREQIQLIGESNLVTPEVLQYIKENKLFTKGEF